MLKWKDMKEQTQLDLDHWDIDIQVWLGTMKEWPENSLEEHMLVGYMMVDKMKELVSVANKFKNLREAQESVEGPCVPYLGVYLGDLIQIEEGNPDLTQTGLVNFGKFEMVGQIITRMEKFKLDRYKLLPVPAIQRFLHDPASLSSDAMFNESLLREGREENNEIKKNNVKKLEKLADFVS